MKKRNWFSGLLGKETPKPELHRQEEPVYLTETVVFGHGDSTVYFVDEIRQIRKLLVDANGVIRNFPGIQKEDFWVRQIPANALLPKVRYRTSFEKRDGRWLMLWTIQPDGDYWRDSSGFGAEDDAEVVLHTYVDGNGDFTGPFRLYTLGECCHSLDRFEHAHARYYETALQSLKSGRLEEHIDVLFPRLQGMELRAGIRGIWEYYTLCSETMAAAWWAHPVLSAHLVEATRALLELDAPATEIFGYPENKIVQGCMTLFRRVTGEMVFQQALDQFFDGAPDAFTEKRLSR